MVASVYLERGSESILKAALEGLGVFPHTSRDDCADVPVADIQAIGRRTLHKSGEITANAHVVGKNHPLTNILVSFPQKKYDLMRELAKGGVSFAEFSLAPAWGQAKARAPNVDWRAACEIALTKNEKIFVNSGAVKSLEEFSRFRHVSASQNKNPLGYQSSITTVHQYTVIQFVEGKFVVVQEKIPKIQAELAWEMSAQRPGGNNTNKPPKATAHYYG